MKNSTKNSDLLKLSSIFALIGLLLIIFNGRIANSFGSIWIHSLGGMSDTNEYIFIKTSYANASLVIGGILLGISLIAMLFSWYQLRS
ncbi:translation initiation factor 2 [Solibacillus isronensis]|uniref:translation initiation factor 2 n=1 Tax=Solibacillus isronensis TaxID=412383 RepID=UPI0009A7EE76|nr:translation initiation factor 2 [Solibacillus isronensis]